MTNASRHVLGVALLAAMSSIGAVAGSHCSFGQTPRTLKIIVPYAAGTAPDTLARLIGDQVAKTNGVTVLVEDRPGGGTVIGNEAAARAAPDGNTLLVIANSFVINSHLRKQNYDPLTSFDPVCNLVVSPQVIVVQSSSPYRAFADFIAAAKAKPEGISVATVGPASTQHIAVKQLEQAAKVKFTYVPFPGGAPAVNALLGGHVNAVLQNYSDVHAHLKAGTLRALATASSTRIAAEPALPTVSELGLADYQAEVWFGLAVPAKSPVKAVSELGQWLLAAIEAPEVKSKLVGQGLYPAVNCGAEFGVHIREQYDRYGRIIRDSRMQLGD